MTTYELWQGAMYCVGVFVTCNVGGLALRAFAGRLTRRPASPPRKQSFAEMMRQVDAHNADYPPDPSGEPGEPSVPAAPESERVTPEELAEAYRRTAPAPDETTAA